MKQALWGAIRKGTGVRCIAYKHRFLDTIPAPGGISKADSLATGAWRGSCTAAGISRLWPMGALSEADAKSSLTTFDSILSKGVGNANIANLGKVRAYISLNDFGSAEATLSKITPAAGQPEYAACLALRLTLAMQRNAVNTVVGEVDDSLNTASVASSDVTALYSELASLYPDDWTIPLVYGEYLQARGEHLSIEILQTAVNLAAKEVAGRKSKSEHYLVDKNSVYALNDYIDYKYRSDLSSSLASVLESELSTKAEPEFEKRLQEYKGLTTSEIRALIGLEASFSAGDFGFAAYSHNPAKVEFNDYTGLGALDTQSLMHRYTGGDIGAVQRGTDKSLDDQIAMANTTSVADEVTDVLGIQKQLGVRLAQQGHARCSVALGNALQEHGRAAEAVAVLDAVIDQSTYLKMHDAFEARGKAHAALTHIDASEKDFKRAFAMETGFEDADIPTMDMHGYRNEF